MTAWTASAKTLLGLLEEERSILTEGRYGDLPGLNGKRMKALERLNRLKPSPEAQPMLDRIRDLAKRNARLATAAREGMAEAEDRLKQIEASAGSVGAYTASGMRVENSGGAATRDRRA